MARSRKSARRKEPGAAPPRAGWRGTRPIWKGALAFGLVNIPVALHTAAESRALDFDLLDRRDLSRVRYRRVSERSGREVPWSEVVKGFPHRKGEYVVLSDEDFRRANVEASETIDILEFVDAAAIAPLYFDTPYYLAPGRGARKGYALLREALARAGKVGIAKVVIRARQHLAALIVQERLLVLNLLRFAHELRDPAALDVPGAGEAAVSAREVDMGVQLVEAMAARWDPKKYRDDYREDLLRLIERKARSRQAKALPEKTEERPGERRGKVVDITDLLKRSLERAQKSPEGGRRAKAG